jgi:hypothetical protein
MRRRVVDRVVDVVSVVATVCVVSVEEMLLPVCGGVRDLAISFID